MMDKLFQYLKLEKVLKSSDLYEENFKLTKLMSKLSAVFIPT